jgi:hypothetical protein
MKRLLISGLTCFVVASATLLLVAGDARAQAWTSPATLIAPGDASTSGRQAAVSMGELGVYTAWIGLGGMIWEGPFTTLGWGPNLLSGAGLGHSGGALAAVVREPTSVDVVWVEADGSVQHLVLGGLPYDVFEGRTQVAPPGSASLTGEIAVVSRVAGSLEVFWIAPDGAVQNASWEERPGQPWNERAWTRSVRAPAGSAATWGGRLSAVSRSAGNLELVWLGRDGSVQSASYGPWLGWVRWSLAPAGSAVPYGAIDLVSREPTSANVFWIAPDGSVQHASWIEGGVVRRFVLAPAGSASVAGAGITAVSRFALNLDVFWVGPNGSVQHADWYGYPFFGWSRRELLPADSAAVTSGIQVVAPDAHRLQLFWTGADATFQSAAWADSVAASTP